MHAGAAEAVMRLLSILRESEAVEVVQEAPIDLRNAVLTISSRGRRSDLDTARSRAPALKAATSAVTSAARAGASAVTGGMVRGASAGVALAPSLRRPAADSLLQMDSEQFLSEESHLAQRRRRISKS